MLPNLKLQPVASFPSKTGMGFLTVLAYDFKEEDREKWTKYWNSMGGTFTKVVQKLKRSKKDSISNPEAYAAALEKFVTGKWPREDGKKKKKSSLFVIHTAAKLTDVLEQALNHEMEDAKKYLDLSFSPDLEPEVQMELKEVSDAQSDSVKILDDLLEELLAKPQPVGASVKSLAEFSDQENQASRKTMAFLVNYKLHNGDVVPVGDVFGIVIGHKGWLVKKASVLMPDGSVRYFLPYQLDRICSFNEVPPINGYLGVHKVVAKLTQASVDSMKYITLEGKTWEEVEPVVRGYYKLGSLVDYVGDFLVSETKKLATEASFEVTCKIVKVKDKWQVQSENGKNLGTYDTKEEAKKRLQQVEMFKHMKKKGSIPQEIQAHFYSELAASVRPKTPEGKEIVKGGETLDYPFGSYRTGYDIVKDGGQFHVEVWNGPFKIFEGPASDSIQEAQDIGLAKMEKENPALFRNVASMVRKGMDTSKIGSGELPNKYYVSTSADFYASATASGSYGWASELPEFKEVTSGSGPLEFGPFDNFQDAFAKFSELFEQLPREPEEGAFHYVMIEDHVSGVIYEGSLYALKTKWGWKFSIDQLDNTGFTSKTLGYDIREGKPVEEVAASKEVSAAEPRQAFYLTSENEIVIVKENVSGYFLTDGSYERGETDRAKLQAIVDELNTQQGLSKEDVDDIIISSMRAQNLEKRKRQKRATKKLAIKLDVTKISPASEVEKAKKKLTDGEIPLLTLSGGRLSEFGGPSAAVAYRIWVHPYEGGDVYVYEADTLEEVKAEVERAKPQGRVEDPIAVVWDAGQHDFREVVIV